MEAVNNINVNKTPGPDNITHLIIKEVKEEIRHSLLILFTESLRQGKAPTEWKYANETPIFRKDVK